MGMQAGGGGGLQSEINVTPMVDVMLVLLIIFMVVTPFLQQGINVAIPRGMKNPDEDQGINKESAVIVSIPKDGDYYLGKKKLNLDDLKSQVEKALANKKEEDKIVYIKSGVNVDIRYCAITCTTHCHSITLDSDRANDSRGYIRLSELLTLLFSSCPL